MMLWRCYLPVSVLIFLCCYTLFSNFDSFKIDRNKVSTVAFRINNLRHRVKTQALLTEQGYIDCLSNGQWIKREKRNVELEKMMYMPSEAELTQPNGECGKDTKVTTERFVSHRALCYPTALKACCYKNRCENKTIEECQCDGCLDLRQRVHAEIHDWQLTSKQCPMLYYDPASACEMLARSKVKHIILVGDSLVRHFFSALLIVLSGRFKDGAMKPNTKQGDIEKCEYHNMFIDNPCQVKLTDKNRKICNSTVLLRLRDAFRFSSLQRSVKYLKSQKDQVILFSVSLHNNLNFTSAKVAVEEYIKHLGSGMYKNDPSLVNHSRSRILFMTPHYPGLMKRNFYLNLHQAPKDVRTYSDKMRKFLADYNIPTFNTSALTRNTFSFDGTHFGYGLNLQLAQTLLNYIGRYDWSSG